MTKIAKYELIDLWAQVTHGSDGSITSSKMWILKTRAHNSNSLFCITNVPENFCWANTQTLRLYATNVYSSVSLVCTGELAFMDWRNKQAKTNANGFVTVQIRSGLEARLCISGTTGFTEAAACGNATPRTAAHLTATSATEGTLKLWLTTVNNKEITISRRYDWFISNPYYILIINAEKQCDSPKTLDLLLALSSISLASDHLWTGRQTERRQRELKTAIKSNDQMHCNWFRKTVLLAPRHDGSLSVIRAGWCFGCTPWRRPLVKRQLLRVHARRTQSDDGLRS